MRRRRMQPRFFFAMPDPGSQVFLRRPCKRRKFMKQGDFLCTIKTYPLSFFPDAAPAADAGPHCPICGEAADTLYIDRWGMTVGCGACVL